MAFFMVMISLTVYKSEFMGSVDDILFAILQQQHISWQNCPVGRSLWNGLLPTGRRTYKSSSDL
jgi:hypothetical protein